MPGTIRRTTAKAALLGASCMMLGLAGQPAFAQQADAAPQPAEAAGEVAADSANVLGDIVVTATKRAESQQRVPIAVTAFDAATIDRVHAINLNSLSAAAPNVQLGSFLSFPTGTAYFIRGIGATNVINTVDPAVATFVDGVYIAAIGVGVPDLFDVGSVEILRGPQGTLFGRNTTAGAVLIRSRRPSGEFGAEARVTIGNYGEKDYKAAVEAPIGEHVAFRLSGTSLNSKGYFRDAATGRRFGGLDVQALRLVTTFEPTSNLDLAVIADYSRDKSGQYGGNCVATPADNSLVLPFGGTCSAFLRKDGTEYTVQQNSFPFLDNRIWGVAAEANLDVGIGTITSITGYRNHDLFNFSDTDFSFAPLGDQGRRDRFDQFTQELRFASSFSDTIDFVAGGFFLHARSRAQQDVFAILFDPALMNPNAPPSFYTQQRQVSAAGFFEANVHVTDRLTLTGGLRYSWERKRLTYTMPLPLAFGGCDDTGIQSCPAVERRHKSWSDLSPKVGVKFQVTPDILLYGNYAKGFRSGGFNGQAGSIAGVGPFEPETVDSLEFGAKTDLLDRRLRLNFALFRNKYTDLQRSVFITPTDQRTLNAADATIQGFELEAVALVADGLRLEGSLGLLDAKYDKFDADLDGNGTIDDNRSLNLQYAPDVTYRLGAVYDRTIGAFNLGANIEYVYTGKLDTHVGNDPRARRASLGLLNAGINFGAADDKWRIGLFGRNLTKELYVQSGEIAGVTSIFRVPGAPRTYGIEFSTKF